MSLPVSGRVWSGTLRPILLVPLLIALSGCAALRTDFAAVERDLARGDAEAALQRLGPLQDSRLNRPLYLMNRGMILRVAGDRAGSIAAFEEAKTRVGELQAVSLSETLAGWTLTETASSYVPPVHEHLMLHVYQMLNFLEQGDLDAARVEALQIDLGLRRVDPRDGEAPDGGDALARYLSGIVFEASREDSDALIAYRKAYHAYRRGGGSVPRDLQQSLVRLTDALELHDERDGYLAEFGIAAWTSQQDLRGRGQVVLLVHDGFAPRLRDESLLVPAPDSGHLIRVALPSLHRRPSGLAGASLGVNGIRHQAEVVERPADTMDRWLSRQMPLLISRAASRNVARYQFTRQVEQDNALLAVLLNVAGALADNADTRSWRTLPDRVWLARLFVEPGIHEVEVLLDGVAGAGGTRTHRISPGGLLVISEHWPGGGSGATAQPLRSRR
ncbi:MAG: hypothetical protein JJT90_04365 [Ectothiorhodospiraceae bacterium]|nr:hypothetical protein [Ectothiorhodospiraceae bacterium]